MKIDPSEKQQHIRPSTNVKTADKGGCENDFMKVLGDTVQNTSGVQPQETAIVQPSMAPSMAMSIGPAQGGSASTTAHGLLNALERYQNLLGDPAVNLKMVSPAVDNMKSLAEKAQPVLDNMPEGDPIKTVVREAQVEISKEIERFHAGYYVDADE